MSNTSKGLFYFYIAAGVMALLFTWVHVPAYLGNGLIGANVHFWKDALFNGTPAGHFLAVDILYYALAGSVFIVTIAPLLTLSYRSFQLSKLAQRVASMRAMSNSNHRVPIAMLWGLILLLSGTPLNAAQFESGPQPAQLLELYTSQGCSSCPPADQWLSQFKTDKALWKHIIPVAFHVTYWDWIGWRDVFANKQFDARQRYYHKQQAISSVYTPGFVVDGQEWRGWFSRSALPKPRFKPGDLKADLKQGNITIRYAAGTVPANIRFHLAVLGFDLTTPVSRGENANQSLSGDFVVLWYRETDTSLTQWQTTLPDTDTLPGKRFGLALWITAPASGELLQTAGGWL